MASRRGSGIHLDTRWPDDQISGRLRSRRGERCGIRLTDFQVSSIDNGNLALREGRRASELTEGSVLDLGTPLGVTSSSPTILGETQKGSAGDQTAPSGSKGGGLVSESCERSRSTRRCRGRRHLRRGTVCSGLEKRRTSTWEEEWGDSERWVCRCSPPPAGFCTEKVARARDCTSETSYVYTTAALLSHVPDLPVHRETPKSCIMGTP